jgi:hypothetical protein
LKREVKNRATGRSQLRGRRSALDFSAIKEEEEQDEQEEEEKEET